MTNFPPVVSREGVRNADNAQRMRWSVEVELPFSEVCMSMKVAGKRMRAIVLEYGMAQLIDGSGALFSGPITRGEAGINSDGSVG